MTDKYFSYPGVTSTFVQKFVSEREIFMSHEIDYLDQFTAHELKNDMEVVLEETVIDTSSENKYWV